jgi:hypothetical protein
MSVYLRFLLLFVAFFFKREITAQVSFVDTVNLTNKTSGLKLWYLGENKYLLSEKISNIDTVSTDSNQIVYTMDSALFQIQRHKEEKLTPTLSSGIFTIELCFMNTHFEMIEMRDLFEKLSELGIRVKVELPLNN